MSPGGIPVHTGWMPEGMWVAITLDNIAAAHLARGDGDLDVVAGHQGDVVDRQHVGRVRHREQQAALTDEQRQAVANLLTGAGADRVISADLHAGQLQGFFDIPVDNLTGIALLAGYFREVLACDTESSPPTIVAPDVGGVVRARKFAGILKTDLAVVDKRRSHEVANLCEVMDVIGDVQGKTAIMVDDIIDTAGTICNAAALLKERGAVKIFACATHGVLSGPALERLEHSAIDSVILTDTIPLPESKKSAKIVQLSIAPLFAEAILRVHSDRSVSSLFD